MTFTPICIGVKKCVAHLGISFNSFAGTSFTWAILAYPYCVRECFSIASNNALENHPEKQEFNNFTRKLTLRNSPSTLAPPLVARRSPQDVEALYSLHPSTSSVTEHQKTQLANTPQALADTSFSGACNPNPLSLLEGSREDPVGCLLACLPFPTS